MPPLAEDLIEVDNPPPKKKCKRRKKRCLSLDQSVYHILDDKQDEFRGCQETDPSLNQLWESAQPQIVEPPYPQFKGDIFLNRRARDRDLAVGSQVLVLLPTSKQKLSAQWQGPYLIIKKFSVSYEVGMHDKAMSKQWFHVDMLQPYHSPNRECLQIGIKNLKLDLQNEDLLTWIQTMTPPKPVLINPSISPTQIQQIRDLLEEFQPPLFSDTPGKVTEEENRGDAPSVYLPAPVCVWLCC